MEKNKEYRLGTRDKKLLLEKFSNISGMEAINSILELDDPSKMIKGLSLVDFFWLVKRVGEDDAHLLLSFASDEQWQYLLDMEIWKKDSLNPVKILTWLEKFFNADGKKLANFFYNEGNLIAHHYFFYNLQVIVKEDDDQEILRDFITFDNLYYIRILDKEHEELIENMLRTLVSEDYNKFLALLLGLAGVIPAEIEEEMYRLKGVRMAENGYLPYEEAISVYSRVDLESISAETSPYKLYLPTDEENSSIVPVTPFFYTKDTTMLAMTTESFSDQMLIDRLYLEFGGLCNQVMSADGTVPEDIDALKKICRKTAGYINIGIERLSGGDLNASRSYIKNNPLISLFRAGFTSALELKWEVARFINKAWYKEKGFTEAFWGEEWEGILQGLLLDKPLFFMGSRSETGFKDFDCLREVEETREYLLRVYAIDDLLSKIYSESTIEKGITEDPAITFHSMLLNYWAVITLGLKPGFYTLSLKEIKALFRLLRRGDERPPYGMPGYEEVFINDLIVKVGDSEKETNVLQEALSYLWSLFKVEYEFINIPDLDIRYIKYFYLK